MDKCAFTCAWHGALTEVLVETGTTNPPLPDGRITPTDARALLETECLKEA